MPRKQGKMKKPPLGPRESLSSLHTLPVAMRASQDAEEEEEDEQDVEAFAADGEDGDEAQSLSPPPADAAASARRSAAAAAAAEEEEDDPHAVTHLTYAAPTPLAATGSGGHQYNNSLHSLSSNAGGADIGGVELQLSPKGAVRSDAPRAHLDSALSERSSSISDGEHLAIDMPAKRSSMIGASGALHYDAAGHGGGDEELEHVLPNAAWNASLQKVLSHFAWNLSVLLLIGGDVVLIVFKVALAQDSPALRVITLILVGTFLAEILGRILAFGREFFKNIWFLIYSLATLATFLFLLDAFHIATQARDIAAIVLQCSSAFLRFFAAGRELAPAARAMVSTNKARYQKHGFDLDLTYITDRVIAMGLPSTNIEAVYRNPIDQVAKFFNKMHKDHYLIANLCSEREYPSEPFHGRVVRFPHDDHNPLPLSTMMQFCVYLDDFLKQDKDNVVAVHCKGGKGRTGQMISCLEEDVLVATYSGAPLRAADVTEETVLVSPRGNPLAVVAVESGESEQLFDVVYEHGHHLVTGNHLVTLRWHRDPHVHTDVEGQVVTLVWYEAKTFERRIKSWHVASEDKVASSTSTLPVTLAPFAGQFALWWLEAAESEGDAHPLRNGDLFDITAQDLAIQHQSAFKSFVSVPMLRGGNYKSVAQQPFVAAETARRIVAAVAAGVEQEVSAGDAEAVSVSAESAVVEGDAVPREDSTLSEQVSAFSNVIGLGHRGAEQVPAAVAPVDEEILAVESHAEARQAFLEQSMRVRQAGSTFSYDATSASQEEAVNVVYMLHSSNASASKGQHNAAGDKAYSYVQLEKLWSLLELDVTGAQIVLSELNSANVVSQLSGALAARPRSIVSFGAPSCAAWVKHAASLSGVDGVEMVFAADAINQRHQLRLRMKDGHGDISVFFAAHPSEANRLDSCAAALSDAHGLTLSVEQVHLLCWGESASPFHGVVQKSGGRFQAIQVAGEEAYVADADMRFVLADSVVTHNCFLLYSKPSMYAEQALKLFATYRTAQDIGGKLQGVSGPSQKRYVNYFEQLRFVSKEPEERLPAALAHLRSSPPMELVTLTLNHVAPLKKAGALRTPGDDKARDVHNTTWNQSANWSLLITHYPPIATLDDPAHVPHEQAGGEQKDEAKAAPISKDGSEEGWSADAINRRNMARYSDTKEFFFPAREKEISDQDDSVTFDMSSFHAGATSLILGGDLKFQIFRGNLDRVNSPSADGAAGASSIAAKIARRAGHGARIGDDDEEDDDDDDYDGGASAAAAAAAASASSVASPSGAASSRSSKNALEEKPFVYAWFWINTAFINQQSNRLILRKEQIDEVARDSKVDPEMNLHLDYFSPPRPASWSHAPHPSFHFVSAQQPLSPRTPKKTPEQLAQEQADADVELDSDPENEV